MRKLLVLAAVGVLFSGLSLLRADDEQEGHHQGRRHVRQVRTEGERPARTPSSSPRTARRRRTTSSTTPSPRRPTRSMGFCKATKDKPTKVKVTGTVEKKDDKLVFTAEKIEKEIDPLRFAVVEARR